MLAGALIDLCVGKFWNIKVQVRGQFKPGEMGKRQHHGGDIQKPKGMPADWFCIFSLDSVHIF